jgi:archaemetzincin
VLLSLFFGCSHQKSEPVDASLAGHEDESLLIDKLKPFDVKLGEPKPHEWLAVHNEKGQPFGTYIKIKPVKATEPRTKLYLQPIGQFSAAEKQLIQYLANYLTIFFGLDTIINPEIDDEMVPPTSRRYLGTPEEQLLTGPILDYLQSNLPDDAAAIMGITNKDLYPNSQLNYVFGLARTQSRVGISSFHRYQEEPIDVTNYHQSLERLIKTSAHEIGHMFTLQHCTHAVCVMNGTNSLFESDERPNRLCSDCLRKLQWNLGFNVIPRAKELALFFKEHDQTEDYHLTQRDITILEGVEH